MSSRVVSTLVIRTCNVGSGFKIFKISKCFCHRCQSFHILEGHIVMKIWIYLTSITQFGKEGTYIVCYLLAWGHLASAPNSCWCICYSLLNRVHVCKFRKELYVKVWWTSTSDSGNTAVALKWLFVPCKCNNCCDVDTGKWRPGIDKVWRHGWAHCWNRDFHVSMSECPMQWQPAQKTREEGKGRGRFIQQNPRETPNFPNDSNIPEPCTVEK